MVTRPKQEVGKVDLLFWDVIRWFFSYPYLLDMIFLLGMAVALSVTMLVLAGGGRR